MKRIVALTIAIAFLAAGCSTMKENKKTTIGAVTGAVVGAGVGYAIGGGTGAGVGTAVGALAGGTIGYMFDKQEKEFKQALADSEAASIQREQRIIDESKQREQEVLVLTFKSDFFFDVDSAVLKPGGYKDIDRAAVVLNRYPETSLRVEGHTDSTGSEDYNLKLSEKRATAVKNELLAQNLDAARIQTIGFGEAKPVADNNTESGRQLNRRVEIVIVPPAEQDSAS
jgi:outer membrane protein OmpA-like peptidoglycan-associated protein